jgi:carbon monoxide dehydrogenase subunit G
MVKKLLIAIFCLMATFAVIFFAPAFFAGSIEYQNTVEIPRSPEFVWQQMIEPEKLGKWLKGLKSIEVLSGSPGKIGSKYRIIVEEDGDRFEAVETVTEVQDHKKFGFTLDGDLLTNDVVVTLEPKGSGTKYTQAESVKPKGILMRAMFFWMQSWMSGRSKEDLDNFRKFVSEI